MKRSKPLRRSRFRSGGPDTEREPKPYAVALSSSTVRPMRAGTYSGGTSMVPVRKVDAVESEPWRKLVASLPCIHCGIFGYSQAAHPNTDKGAGIKTDDRDCFPLCTIHPSPGGKDFVTGCHERFDQGALFTKEARRELEPAWGRQTRYALMAAGAVPARLATMLKLQPDGGYAP